MPKTRQQQLQEKGEKGFLGFWIRKSRISYLCVLGIIFIGINSVLNIPKESTPAVNLGFITITTPFPGASPENVDQMVTDKIYKEIKEIKGINKILSTSQGGVSSIIIELKAGVKTKDTMNDIRGSIGRITLPSDAKEPTITEIESTNSLIFSPVIYAKDTHVSRSRLAEQAVKLKNELEKLSTIDTVDISQVQNGGVLDSGGGDGAVAYDVHIVVDEEKLRAYNLSLESIAGMIKGLNVDQPIGNFSLANKSYDYRISGKNETAQAYLATPIALPNGGSILLGDIATLKRNYISDIDYKILIATGGTAHSVYGLNINKKESATVFTANSETREALEKIFTTPEFSDFGYTYTFDLASYIISDYKNLGKEAIVTLILVFVAMYLFVGFFDSLFATLTLPLAFLSTFIILDKLGYSMNFLTNFSLVLSFGIAIDTIIVIVQAASIKLRLGYNPRSAISLALKEYAKPIIAGVSTTIVVFIPMMALPGVMGKFLAYIPITIFGVLAFGLFLALTLNSALYLLVVRKKKTYVDSPELIEYFTQEQKELLALDREGKTRIDAKKANLRTRAIHSVIEGYKKILTLLLTHTWLRRTSIFLPVVCFFASIFYIAPLIPFELMPSDDNNAVSYTIEGPVGIDTERMLAQVGDISTIFSGFPEVETVGFSTNAHTMNISVTLFEKEIRKAKKQKSVYELADIFRERLASLETQGLKVTQKLQEKGPPGGSPIAIKLLTSSHTNLDTLIKVSKDFEEAFKNMSALRDISSSSQDTPGQFIFELKKDRISEYGINPQIIVNEITQNTRGITLGNIEDYGADMDIILRSSRFEDDISSDAILDLPITLKEATYRIGDFVEVKTHNATDSISRENGDIQITVSANLAPGFDTVSTNARILDFTKSYAFPEDISWSIGGENAENAELIHAIITSFILALLVIFGILTFLFDSYSQPLIILYSVVMSLPVVMLGLFFTDNPFSIMFAIGFISFTGIAVNHAIILIDAINHNLKKGMDVFVALIEAGASRFEPMVLTTVATALGILPIALRDRFWSGMGFTIIFGVITASLLTLFVVKSIYYELYMKSKKQKPTFFKRIFMRMRRPFQKKQKAVLLEKKQVEEKNISQKISSVPPTGEVKKEASL